MVKMHYIIFCLCFSSIMAAQSNNCHLEFENFNNYGSNTTMIAELNDKTLYNSVSDLNAYSQIEKFKIERDLKSWLYNQNVISRWSKYKNDPFDIYPNNYEEFINERKEEIDLYYIGRIKVKRSFKSYGFLVVERLNSPEFQNGEFVNRKIIVVNVHEGLISCIFEGNRYSTLEGHTTSKSTMKMRGKFFHFYYFAPPQNRKELKKSIGKSRDEHCSFDFSSSGKIINVL